MRAAYATEVNFDVKRTLMAAYTTEPRFLEDIVISGIQTSEMEMAIQAATYLGGDHMPSRDLLDAILPTMKVTERVSSNFYNVIKNYTPATADGIEEFEDVNRARKGKGWNTSQIRQIILRQKIRLGLDPHS